MSETISTQEQRSAINCGRLLHLCLGGSPDRLSCLGNEETRSQLVGTMNQYSARLPTVFVVNDRANLAVELARHNPNVPVLKSARRSALDINGIDSYLKNADTVVLTGLETSYEIYATAAELATFGVWNLLIPEHAVADRHSNTHGACLHILAHGYKDSVAILPQAEASILLVPASPTSNSKAA